jgi:hypothetical protein
MRCGVAIAIIIVSRITAAGDEVGARRVATLCQIIVAAIISMRSVDLCCTEIWTRATFPASICTGATAVCAVFIDAQLICGTNRAHLTAE